jgi:hypothetical protein
MMRPVGSTRRFSSTRSGYKTLSVPVVRQNALLVADVEGRDRE